MVPLALALGALVLLPAGIGASPRGQSLLHPSAPKETGFGPDAFTPLPSVPVSTARFFPHLGDLSNPLPSGVGVGPSRVLATVDLLHDRVAPGAGTSSFNAIGPIASAFDPHNGLLYTATYASNQVQIVNVSTQEGVGVVSVGQFPTAVAYDPAGGEIFVADWRSNDVMVINDTSNVVVARLPMVLGSASIGAGPFALAYDPLNRTMLVAENPWVGGSSHNLTIVDGVTNQLVGEWPAPDNVVGLSYDPGNDRVYSVSGTRAEVGVVDLRSGTSLGPWPLNLSGGASDLPSGIAADPLDSRVFVAETDPGATTETLTVLNATSGVAITNVSIPLLSPVSWAVPSYSSADSAVYVTTEGDQLITVGAANATLTSAPSAGRCLDGVALDGSGAPLVVPDSCANALLWFGPSGATILTPSPVGVEPVLARPFTGTGGIAVLESGVHTGQVRLDRLDPFNLSVTSRVVLPAGACNNLAPVPVSATSDPGTGWLYEYDECPVLGGLGGCPFGGGCNQTSLLSAFDPSTGAPTWTWNGPSWGSSSGVAFLVGLADSGGTIFVHALTGGIVPQGDALFELNATSGAVVGNQSIAPYVWSPVTAAFAQTSIVPVANTSLVVVADQLNSEVVAVNVSSGQVQWARPTGNGTGPAASLSSGGLIAVGAGNNSTPQLLFLHATTGAIAGVVQLPSLVRSITRGGTPSDVYVQEGGEIDRVDFQGLLAGVVVLLPLAAGPGGLAYVPQGGGVVLLSEVEGTLSWIGAALDASNLTTVGPTVQGEDLTLDANVSGGFGPYNLSYTGLPTGCASANLTQLICLPVSAGPSMVLVSARDRTGDVSSAGDALDLSPYPLVAQIAGPLSNFTVGESATFSVELDASETGIATYLRYNWTLDPLAAGGLNRTNASTITVRADLAGAATLHLTVDFRGTPADAERNLSLLSPAGPGPGVSAMPPYLLLGVGLGIAAVATVAAVVLWRRRRRRDLRPR